MMLPCPGLALYPHFSPCSCAHEISFASERR
jgi:hypothetical protein